jgi:hypothetical protein
LYTQPDAKERLAGHGRIIQCQTEQ